MESRTNECLDPQGQMEPGATVTIGSLVWRLESSQVTERGLDEVWCIVGVDKEEEYLHRDHGNRWVFYRRMGMVKCYRTDVLQEALERATHVHTSWQKRTNEHVDALCQMTPEQFQMFLSLCGLTSFKLPQEREKSARLLAWLVTEPLLSNAVFAAGWKRPDHLGDLRQIIHRSESAVLNALDAIKRLVHVPQSTIVVAVDYAADAIKAGLEQELIFDELQALYGIVRTMDPALYRLIFATKAGAIFSQRCFEAVAANCWVDVDGTKMGLGDLIEGSAKVIFRVIGDHQVMVGHGELAQFYVQIMGPLVVGFEHGCHAGFWEAWGPRGVISEPWPGWSRRVPMWWRPLGDDGCMEIMRRAPEVVAELAQTIARYYPAGPPHKVEGVT